MVQLLDDSERGQRAVVDEVMGHVPASRRVRESMWTPETVIHKSLASSRSVMIKFHTLVPFIVGP